MANAQTAPKSKAVRAPAADTAPRKSRAKAKPATTNLADATAQTPKMQAAPEHEVTQEQRVADRRADDSLRGDNAMKFMTQQLSNDPAAAAAKQAAFEKDLAELKAKHNVNADVIVKPPKASKIIQNNITRPAASSLCGKIWALADEISARQHSVAAIASVREHASMKTVNDHTIKTQYQKWRKFHGVAGRLPTIHAVHQDLPGYDDLTPHVAGSPAKPAAEAPKPE